MIHKVVMTHSVTLFIKHDNEEDLADFLAGNTPDEAFRESVRAGGYPEESFSEEIICEVDPNSEPDLVLKERR